MKKKSFIATRVHNLQRWFNPVKQNSLLSSSSATAYQTTMNWRTSNLVTAVSGTWNSTHTENKYVVLIHHSLEDIKSPAEFDTTVLETKLDGFKLKYYVPKKIEKDKPLLWWNASMEEDYEEKELPMECVESYQLAKKFYTQSSSDSYKNIGSKILDYEQFRIWAQVTIKLIES